MVSYRYIIRYGFMYLGLVFHFHFNKKKFQSQSVSLVGGHVHNLLPVVKHLLVELTIRLTAMVSASFD